MRSESSPVVCRSPCISQPHPVLSGVSQGTVLGPLLFLIMIIDIDKGISPSSKLVSFSDDTRVYSCVNDIEKCDQLQIDLNSVYYRNLIMYHLMVL